MADVLCFGNLQLDVLCSTITTLPPPGELRNIDAIAFSLSGNGGNVAAVLGRLGLAVDLAGYSGADVIGEQFRATLSEQGVGITTLLRHPAVGTGTSIITLSPDGERSVFFVNGANALFDLNTVPDEWLQEKCVVSVSSLFVLPQFSGEAVGALFARARKFGATTILNICSDIQGQGLSFLQPALAETDFFLLNAHEGWQLTGQRQPAEIVASLASYTSGTVVVTRGAEGCCWLDSSGLHSLPALPVKATDCTGAGDAFVAGFIAGIVSKHSVYVSAQLGCLVAAFAVTGPGAYQRTPPLSTLTQHLPGMEGN